MRQWGGGRGAGGRPGLKGTVETSLLRPLLEAAMLVAREGERESPPRIAPQPLRRYLSFARLPDPALEVARRVLDEDAEFRQVVTAAVDESRVGRAGWLFVTRPEGWQAEIETLVQQASAAELAAKEDRAERGAQRRLAGAEAALARAEAAATAALQDAAEARAELDAERAASARLREALTRAEAELDGLRASRSETIARLKEAEAALAARNAELRAVRHELRMVQAELDQQERPVGDDDGEADAGVEGERDAAAALEAAAAVAARDARLAGAVSRAAEAAGRLGQALAEATEMLGGVPPSADAEDPDADVEAPPSDGPERRSRRATRSRRRPAPLPPGLRDDVPEAAERLVRLPGALLLVDGYNISHAQWAALRPAEQRSRLLDACAELHARCGTAVEVVFDGDQDTESTGSLTRSGVRYRFTSAAVEADDVLLERVEEEPIDRPVIVASSDRRVRDGARARGANVIGARQALAVLRR